MAAPTKEPGNAMVFRILFRVVRIMKLSRVDAAGGELQGLV
jgi:hypothetical protein